MGEGESERRRDERHIGENKYHSVSPSFTHSLSREVGVEVWRTIKHQPHSLVKNAVEKRVMGLLSNKMPFCTHLTHKNVLEFNVFKDLENEMK